MDTVDLRNTRPEALFGRLVAPDRHDAPLVVKGRCRYRGRGRPYAGTASRAETSMATNRVYRVAVIPGDGIGKEVVPEGVRVLEAAAKKFGFEIAAGLVRLRLLRLLRQARPHDAGGLEGAHRPARRDLLRRRRLAGEGAGPHLAVGLADPVPARVRPVRQPAAGAADARRAARRSPTASPATSTSGSCARTPRASTPRSAGACSTAPSASSWCRRRCMTPHRRRPRAEVRLRARAKARRRST